MAKRKAAELEDFEGDKGSDRAGGDDAMEIAGDTVKEGKPTAEDVEKGTRMLKQVLKQWKAEVEGKGFGKEEMVRRMRDLVKGNQELLASPFLKEIRAL